MIRLLLTTSVLVLSLPARAESPALKVRQTDDEVIIELPEGWDLDEPVAPASSKLGEVGGYAVEVRKTTDGRKLIYRRRFDWGRESRAWKDRLWIRRTRQSAALGDGDVCERCRHLSDPCAL